MSSGVTIPSYQRTNAGVGGSSEDVIYSDTASGTVGSTAAFLSYTTNSVEFSIKSTLSSGKRNFNALLIRYILKLCCFHRF